MLTLKKEINSASPFSTILAYIIPEEEKIKTPQKSR
jgi:hypothetical protein